MESLKSWDKFFCNLMIDSTWLIILFIKYSRFWLCSSLSAIISMISSLSNILVHSFLVFSPMKALIISEFFLYLIIKSESAFCFSGDCFWINLITSNFCFILEILLANSCL